MSVSQPRYEIAESVEQVRRRLAEEESIKIIAGGQSLMLLIRQNLVDAAHFLDISEVPEYSGISHRDERIEIRAATTYEQAERHPALQPFGAIQDAISQIADRQVRNMGTIGGAISHCDASLDIVPPLLTRGAEVRIGHLDGERREALSEFIVGFMETGLAKDELVESIDIPVQGPHTGSAYEKHSNVKGGWATVGVGADITLSEDGDEFAEVMIALSAVGETALRAKSVEDALVGTSVSVRGIQSAAEKVVGDIDPLADISGSKRYKERLAQGLTTRTVQRAVERARGEAE